MFDVSVMSVHICTKALNLQWCIKGGKIAEDPSSTKTSFWWFQKFVCSGGCGVCCIGVKFGEVKSQHCSGAAKVADVPRIQF